MLNTIDPWISEEEIKRAFGLLQDFTHNHDGFDYLESIPTYERMKVLMQAGEKLTFILPAFPAKSPSPEKTSGILPDLGEVLALKALHELCAKIGSFYAPGAQVIICSDGRVFSDVVMVSDEDIDRYSAGIGEIIEEFELKHLTTFSMDDLFPELSGDDLRAKLLREWGKDLEEVRFLVKHDDNYKRLFNGIHRFLLEDQLVLHASKSRAQVHRESKALTYELIRRSDAWSALLNHLFKNTLRLSIHPYPVHHEKFGIKLLKTSSKWATPWHNVTVRIMDRFELMHLKDVVKLNGVRKLFKDKYVYYEV